MASDTPSKESQPQGYREPDSSLYFFTSSKSLAMMHLPGKHLYALLVLTFMPGCHTIEEDDQQTAIELPAESAFSTGLPVLVINTPDSCKIQSKTEWVRNAGVSLYAPDGQLLREAHADIRGRGNVTWSRYPKKPYSLRFDEDCSLLGMAADKRWVLLANWADRTLLRNDVAFEIARRTSLEWTPQGKAVELVLNGEYRGSYYLCEKIQVGSNRLNIIQMDETDNDEESITGGYLMEIDAHFDEPNKFRSATYRLPYLFRSPDDDMLTQAQYEYMEDYICSVEHSIADDEALLAGDYSRFLDPLSFIDWWIVNELCFNREIGKLKSIYVYKDRGQPLKAGPVWDYDFATFTLHDEIYVACHFPYLQRLFACHEFQKMARERWEELRPALENIPDYIDTQAERLRMSAENNIRLWPVTSKGNDDERLSYEEAIERMKQAFDLRMHTIDNYTKNF